MKLFHLCRITFLIVTSLFLECKPKSKHSKSVKKEDISYAITFDEANPKLAKVKATFVPKDSILYMSWGASNLPKRWATFVKNTKVTDKSKQPIKIEELGDAKWKMFTKLNEEVTLSYDVYLEHENYKWRSGIDAVAYSTELGVFYTGRTLFILNGEERKNINVTFNLPQKWKVTTPWLIKDLQPNNYKIKNTTDLVTALIFAGRHKEFSLKRDAFQLVFALGSNAILRQEEEFANLAQGVLDYYIDLMGGIPNPSPNNPLYKSVVVISSSNDKTDGEAIGNNISILIEKNGDNQSKTFSRFIFAHEFFHLWNGKSFSPIADDTEWFKEGFTNYYTLKALHNVGFLNDKSYLDFLSNFFYDKYKNDEGVGKLSMTDGGAKHKHWGLVYAGGMFVGIAQDIIIRNATNNEKSIDDLMKSFFTEYGGSNNSYSLKELENKVSELSGINQTDFFNSYVKGRIKIPIDKYLTQIGLNAKVEKGKLTINNKKQLTKNQKKMLKGVFGLLNNINK